MSSYTFKNEITNQLIFYILYIYIYLNVCKQMNDIKLLVT